MSGLSRLAAILAAGAVAIVPACSSDSGGSAREQAEGFPNDTEVTIFALLWEPTGQSWVDNAVAALPYMILIVDGEDVERWPGGASVRQIEDALASYS